MYLNSRAAMAPGGLVTGLDELGAAIAGGIAKGRERAALDQRRREEDRARLDNLALTAGINPAGQTDDELRGAIAGGIAGERARTTARQDWRDQLDESRHADDVARQERRDQSENNARAGAEADREATRQDAAARAEIADKYRSEDREDRSSERENTRRIAEIGALSKIVGDPDVLPNDKQAAQNRLNALLGAGGNAASAPGTGRTSKIGVDLSKALAGQPSGFDPASSPGPAPAAAAPLADAIAGGPGRPIQGHIKAPVTGLPGDAVFDPSVADDVEAGFRREAKARGVDPVTYARQKLAQFPPQLRQLYEQHFGLAPVAPPADLNDVPDAAFGGL
jgi:hypothetical protein